MLIKNELFQYVGESERAVRALFQRARNSKPCVIFFDEIDAICVKRSDSNSDSGATTRVVNQMLTEMDGLESRKGVFLMAASNRPGSFSFINLNYFCFRLNLFFF